MWCALSHWLIALLFILSHYISHEPIVIAYWNSTGRKDGVPCEKWDNDFPMSWFVAAENRAIKRKLLQRNGRDWKYRQMENFLRRVGRQEVNYVLNETFSATLYTLVHSALVVTFIQGTEQFCTWYSKYCIFRFFMKLTKLWLLLDQYVKSRENIFSGCAITRDGITPLLA